MQQDNKKDNAGPQEELNLSVEEISKIEKELEIDKNTGIPMLEDESIESLNQHKIPNYLVDVYNWAYVKPKNIDLLDRPIVYHTILFGQGWKLMRAYLEEFSPTDRVLQVAHVYGNVVRLLAEKVAKNGSLDIIDVVPHQLKRAAIKLKGVEGEENIDMWLQDASEPYHKQYDVVGIYFLLHEVPDPLKKRIIENALKVIDETGGKIVFIDYYNPSYYNPVRQILRFINYTLEPFANAMWHREIKDFITKNRAGKYNWKQTTYFGGVYQKVVVTKKTDEELGEVPEDSSKE
ncbi:MAG: rhodoquinone biosynthesis methyltransferase RquA [Alphaproteobacteria bacterium]|nr:rhodoquinone biosynthesis methyltransferase RquA [Alphaproteobacteria bacterium]